MLKGGPNLVLLASHDPLCTNVSDFCVVVLIKCLGSIVIGIIHVRCYVHTHIHTHVHEPRLVDGVMRGFVSSRSCLRSTHATPCRAKGS